MPQQETATRKLAGPDGGSDSIIDNVKQPTIGSTGLEDLLPAMDVTQYRWQHRVFSMPPTSHGIAIMAL
jgi:hypothetical protein